MTAAALLSMLANGKMVPGRHLVVTAHPDDETISLGGALSAFGEALIVQITDGVHVDDPNRALLYARRREERAEAFAAGRWAWQVVDCGLAARQAVHALRSLQSLLAKLVAEYTPTAIWTHPYEGGHLDHDSAAWAVAHAGGPALRLEFASYYAPAPRQSVFGAFWPDKSVPSFAVPLGIDRLTRKRAAMACYASQAGILAKFLTPQVECYRQAPAYDFSLVPPPPSVRWDDKGYAPSSAAWRVAARQASEVLA